MIKRTCVSKLFMSTTLALILPATSLQAETIAEAVRQALDNNPRVQASEQEINIRNEERTAVRAGYYPTLDLTATYGRESTNRPGTRAIHGDEFVDLDRREVGIELRQNLFNGFATTRLSEQQGARVESAKSELTDTREQVSLEAANAYLRVMREQQVLELSREFLASHQAIHDKIKARSKAGVGKRADLDQAEGRLALARSNMIAAEANLEDARATYLRVVGAPAPAQMSMPGSASAAMPASFEAALKTAQEGNAALAAANTDVEAARAERAAAKGTFYPSLDLVLARNWNEDIAGIEGDDENYGAYLQMRYNLLNGGGDTAQEKAAAGRLAKAKSRRDDVQWQVTESLRLAWNAYEAVNQQLQYLKIHERASQRTRDAYNKQFSIGQRTLLDLLDTENELFEARRDVVRAEFDRLGTQYRVQALTGSLQSLLVGSNL
jgi:adhesin transport system outer membrane protein